MSKPADEFELLAPPLLVPTPSTAVREEGVLGLNAYEHGLLARALGQGEPLDGEEVAQLRKIARLAELRRDDVRRKITDLATVLGMKGEEETAADLLESLRHFEEATTALLDAVKAVGTDG